MRLLILSLLAAISVQAHAQPNFSKDIAGGSDHPLLHRYEGSMLYMYGGENLGPARIVDSEAGKPVLQKVEGKTANRFYWGPKGRSALEIHRNYQQALTAAGFKILYACETDQCEKAKVQRLVQELPREANWKSFDAYVSSIFNSANQPRFHLVSAAKAGPGGNTHVMVALSEYTDYQRVRQFVQIVEPTVMEGGKVTVDTRAMGWPAARWQSGAVWRDLRHQQGRDPRSIQRTAGADGQGTAGAAQDESLHRRPHR